jgi:hypothetical protein
MTRKDFELIAKALNDYSTTRGDYAQDRKDKAEFFADILTSTNPRFDRARFLTACGVK